MLPPITTAIGNLLAHFYTKHNIALTEPEVWLINQIMSCSDITFNPFEMLDDVLGLSLDNTDCAALMEYHECWTRHNDWWEGIKPDTRYCPN